MSTTPYMAIHAYNKVWRALCFKSNLFSSDNNTVQSWSSSVRIEQGLAKYVLPHRADLLRIFPARFESTSRNNSVCHSHSKLTDNGLVISFMASSNVELCRSATREARSADSFPVFVPSVAVARAICDDVNSRNADSYRSNACSVGRLMGGDDGGMFKGRVVLVSSPSTNEDVVDDKDDNDADTAVGGFPLAASPAGAAASAGDVDDVCNVSIAL
mmetsp:Transcript_52265/g.126355  ORF Transcript_52265/g.126355 Transcript_52265/m.126355 type:complete len:215 (-) Transcript_52265:148-792(-)